MLEKDALSWELLIHKKEKEAGKMEKKTQNIPSFYIQSINDVSNDINNNIDDMINKKIEIKDLMRLDIQKKRKEKNYLSHEIGNILSSLFI